MADVKISALPLASTPLAGTEVLPIVQSATTDQVSVANLTAGRSVSAASLTLTTTPLAVGSGGTGLGSLTAGYIPYGAGTSAFGSSANLFWDSANARLGIQNLSPAAPLDVGGNVICGGSLGVGTTPSYTVHAKKTTSPVYITSETTNATGIAGLILYCSNASLTNAYGLFEYAYNGEFNLNNAFATGVHKFSIGGGEKMRITAAGRVGIGTATPSVNLAINSAANTTGTANTFRLFDDGSAATSTTSNSFGFGFNAATGQLSYTTGVAGLHVFYTTNTERMRIDSSGNVGIGTASPGTYKLNVVNSASNLALFSGNNANNFIAISDNGGTTTCSFGSISGGNSYTFTAGYHATYAGNSERFRVDASGNIICNTAAIATTATDGFLYVPTCAGTPTGTPTTYTGRAPIVVNTTNNKLYFYSGGAWRDAGP